MKALSLSNKNIDSTVRETENFLKENSISRENSLRLTLTMEEILLRYQDRFGEKKEYIPETGKRLGISYITISVPGEAFNPISQDDDDWSTRVLADLGLAPLYSYRKGVNRITVYLKKIISKAGKKVFIASASAFVLGQTVLLLCGDQASVLREMLVVPLLDSILSLFMLVAVPMIFISILYGTSGMENISELKKAGNNMVFRFVSKSFMLTFAAGLLMLPFFSLNITGSGDLREKITESLSLITDILPVNSICPFLHGKTLQIVLVAVVTGILLVASGEKGNLIRRLTEEANAVIFLMTEWISRLIPFVMFLIVLKTLWGENSGIALRLWKPLLFTFITCFSLPILYTSIVGLKIRSSCVSLLKKLLPSYVVAYTTMSSAAAYGTNLECCEKKLGINKKLTNMGISVGTVMYKPTTSIFFLICIMFGLETCGQSCSPGLLLTGCITATLLSIAIPPIPGGAITGFAFLFSQMGIPTELAGLAIAMDTIIDRYSTASNVTTLKLELLRQADRQKMLNRKKLESEKK